MWLGDFVNVYDKNGNFVGGGFYNLCVKMVLCVVLYLFELVNEGYFE